MRIFPNTLGIWPQQLQNTDWEKLLYGIKCYIWVKLSKWRKRKVSVFKRMWQMETHKLSIYLDNKSQLQVTLSHLSFCEELCLCLTFKRYNKGKWLTWFFYEGLGILHNATLSDFVQWLLSQVLMHISQVLMHLPTQLTLKIELLKLAALKYVSNVWILFTLQLKQN